jgi:hypothetical protein
MTTKPMTDAQRAAKEARRRENSERWAASPHNRHTKRLLAAEAVPTADAIPFLLAIMTNATASPRDRLNAAVAASRVEKLQMPGEPAPESVRFLRDIIADDEAPTNLRLEAATACAYFERRSQKAALTFDVADVDEKRRQWRRLVNGGIRHHLAKHGRWPADKAALLGPDDAFDLPEVDPNLVLSALLLGGSNRHARRRQKAIDQPVTGVWSGSERERTELLKVLAQAMHQRLAEFKLAG